VDEVKITEDLQRVRRQAVKKQDQGNDGAVLLILDELIERIARAETQVAEADFNFGGWRAIKKRLEAQVAALTEQLRVLSQPVRRAEIERSYRGSGWIGFANRFNQIIAARSAAPGKDVEDAGGIHV
jgi:hypothetical protein